MCTRYIVYKIQNLLCNYWQLSQHITMKISGFQGNPALQGSTLRAAVPTRTEGSVTTSPGWPFLTGNDMVKPWETMGNPGKPWETSVQHLKTALPPGSPGLYHFLWHCTSKVCSKGIRSYGCVLDNNVLLEEVHRPSFMIQANYARKMHHLWGTNLNWVLQTTSSVRPHRENEKATWMTLYRTWPIKERIEETIHCGNTRRMLNTKYISKYYQ